MPSLIGTGVASNYRQQIVPFSRFGTRKVAWYKIGHTDFASDDGVLDMPNFNKIIDSIQTQMEIVMVGAPYIDNDTGWNKFMVCVFEDTANDGSNTELSGNGDVGFNSNSLTLQDTLDNLNLGGNVSVERFYLYGAPADGNTSEDGFSVDSSRQEYSTKAEFVDNSYVF